MERWMSSFVPPRKVYSVGPQLPSGPMELARSGDLAQSTASAAVLDFLDNKLQSHRQRSVLYVRMFRVDPWSKELIFVCPQILFGTVWGPWSNPDLLWIILEVLKGRNMPFVSDCMRLLSTLSSQRSWMRRSWFVLRRLLPFQRRSPDG